MKQEAKINLIFASQTILVLMLLIGLLASFNILGLPASSKFADVQNLSPMDSSQFEAGARYQNSAPASLPGAATSLILSTAHADEGAQKSKYLVKNGNIKGKVDSLEKAKLALPELLKKHNASVISENESNSRYTKNLNFTVRVPALFFERIMTDLSELTAHLDTKSSQIQDKMKEFVEIEERIKSKKLLRDKFRELLKKSKKIENTLRIEKEINQIQEEFEASKKMLENLQNKITLSTINVSYYESISLSKQKRRVGFISQVSNALFTGWGFLRSTVLLIISLWPFILIGIILFLLIKTYRKKKMDS